MSDKPRLKSTAAATLLDGARKGLDRLDEAVAGLELANATGSPERSFEISEAMASTAQPCFVLSTGRTGTMTLTALLGASPGVDAHHEPEPRLLAASFLAWMGSEPNPTFWKQAMAVARDPLVLAAHKRGKVYFEGSNRMTLLAPALAERYPRSRFLLVTRRPEGFIRSALRRGYYLGHPWDHARIRPRTGEPLAASWDDLSAEARCAWLWTATHESALDFASSLAPARSAQLHAEDLFAGKRERLAELFDFLGVESPGSRRIDAVLERKLNKQEGTHPWGREPTWTDAEKSDLLEGLEPLVRRLGYDDAS